MVLLIDGDYIPWVVSYNCREASYPYELEQEVDRIISSLVQKTNADQVTGYLGLRGFASFRVEVATIRPYKGKRGEKPPYFEMWGETVTSYLKSRYNFQEAEPCTWSAVAYETDDMVATHARILREAEQEHVIVSTDKDLKQIPGTHLNPTKMEFREISPEEAAVSLWTQALTGDATDNIQGITKCGPVAAQRILASTDGILTMQEDGTVNYPSSKEFPYRVLKAYMDHYGQDNGIRYYTENFRLVRLVDTVPLSIVTSYEPGAMIL